MRKTDKYLLIDTETVGDIPFQRAYDVGAVVTDSKGEIYETCHFLVEETFSDLRDMSTAYYANKFVGYLHLLEAGAVHVRKFYQICQYLDNMADRWNVKYLAAYNLGFDKRAMENTCRALYGFKKWSRREYKDFCVFTAACEVLYGKKYIKAARLNGWETDKGNVKTSAEMGYRFISGESEFIEEHRGLQDCMIEAQLLAAVKATHKKHTGRIMGFPSRMVYNREK